MEEGETTQIKDKKFLKKVALIIGSIFACLMIIQHGYVFMCFTDMRGCILISVEYTIKS